MFRVHAVLQRNAKYISINLFEFHTVEIPMMLSNRNSLQEFGWQGQDCNVIMHSLFVVLLENHHLTQIPAKNF